MLVKRGKGLKHSCCELIWYLSFSHTGARSILYWVRKDTIEMAKDLDRMSLRELAELELKVRKARASVQDRSRADVRKKVEQIITEAGFKVTDIFGGRGGKGRTVAAKYANPDDPSETWTGRGRKPRWLSAKLADGAKMEKFIIKSASLESRAARAANWKRAGLQSGPLRFLHCEIAPANGPLPNCRPLSRPRARARSDRRPARPPSP